MLSLALLNSRSRLQYFSFFRETFYVTNIGQHVVNIIDSVLKDLVLNFIHVELPSVSTNPYLILVAYFLNVCPELHFLINHPITNHGDEWVLPVFRDVGQCYVIAQHNGALEKA